MGQIIDKRYNKNMVILLLLIISIISLFAGFISGFLAKSDKLISAAIPISVVTPLISWMAFKGIIEDIIKGLEKELKIQVRNEFKSTIKKQEIVFFDAIKHQNFNSEYDILLQAINKIIYTNKGDNFHLLAIIATQEVTGKHNSSQAEMRADPEFVFLKGKIYLILRGWLVYSILLQRVMPIKEKIELRFPNSKKTTDYSYKRAFQYIKDYISDFSVEIYAELDREEKEILKSYFDEYLDKLIKSPGIENLD